MEMRTRGSVSVERALHESHGQSLAATWIEAVCAALKPAFIGVGVHLSRCLNHSLSVLNGISSGAP